MKVLKKIVKYYQTLKYLKKSQLGYLVKNRLERGKRAVTSASAPDSRPLSLWMPGLDADREYLERFCLEELLSGKVTLLYESGEPGGMNWANPDRSHLWNFNLHYLEFLIPLAAAYQRERDIRYYQCFRDYCRRWIADNREGTQDGWHPYTISLRLTNLWICEDAFREALLEDKSFFGELNDSMYAQYLHLQKRLELHLLGNHYFENLKAVMLGALYFQEPAIYERYKKKFREEIAEQILPDGVHYERSFMYHKIILEDLMRAAKAVQAEDMALYTEIFPVVRRMADAMYSIEENMGHTPLFNDAGDNVARPYRSLLRALKEEFGIRPAGRLTFSDAGYYCLENGRIKIVMDAGAIAPDHMPGHGHCDGLSFELSLEGEPLFVNAGTGQYQGSLRSFFRSTAAHNTVVIDGEEQSRCWGEHRVAGRITDVSGSCEDGRIKGSLMTCTGKRQSRTIRLNGNEAEIRDRVSGQAKCYFHLAPGYRYIRKDTGILVEKASGGNGFGRIVCEMRFLRTDRIVVHTDGNLCSYAPEFGRLERIQVLEAAWSGDGNEHVIYLKFT